MSATSAHEPSDQAPTPSVGAVLAACAAARTVSTPPTTDDDAREQAGQEHAGAADERRPAPDRDAA